MECRLCPRNCGADREKQAGYCGAGAEMKVGRICRHAWEEPPVSGTRGSGTVFFAGCSLRCVYCQNYSLSRGREGTIMTPAMLADAFRMLEDAGAHNINLVTADHYIPQILKAFEIYRPDIPVVYNCSGYEKVQTLDMLAGVVDIWLPDYKYAFSDVARLLSGAPDYPQTAERALTYMRRLAPIDEFDDQGIMRKGMIVRHLVLPSFTDNSLAVVGNIAQMLGKDTYVSLMSQYYPCGEAAGIPAINRTLKPLEYKVVVAKAEKLGMRNVFVQEEGSAKAAYTPLFDGSVSADILSDGLQ